MPGAVCEKKSVPSVMTRESTVHVCLWMHVCRREINNAKQCVLLVTMRAHVGLQMREEEVDRGEM